MSKAPATTTMTIRLPSDLRDRLDAAIDAMQPYKPSVTTVVQRGLELAIAELDAMKSGKP